MCKVTDNFNGFLILKKGMEYSVWFLIEKYEYKTFGLIAYP